jgi:hypothetical protein
MLKLGINQNISNVDYHNDREYLSSSALKLALKDSEKYYSRYILNEKEVVGNQSALDFGTAAHLKILEPHLFHQEIAIFNGPIKRGKIFDEFKLTHPDKLILSKSQNQLLTGLYEAYSNNGDAYELLRDCEFEYTMCGLINDTKIKVRADAINLNLGYIADVKTTGYSGDIETFTQTISDFGYDLSAALYCSVAESIYKTPFDFYYIVLSKIDSTCHVYKTSKKSMAIGKSQVDAAIEKIKRFKLTNNYSNAIIETEQQFAVLEI